MHIHTRSAVALAGLLLATGSLAAQPQPPGGGVTRSPTVSPYLNLANRGGVANPGITYLGIVRPQQQFAQQNNLLQQQLSQTNAAVAGNQNALNDALFTGRGAVFGYYSHYFYNSPTGGGGAGGGGGSGFGGFRQGAVGAAGFAGGGGAAAAFRAGGAGGGIGQAPQGAARSIRR